ncbi:hypothetical protein BBK36DRAFT_1121418 [Trichoderma citrinoviride]|uniref:PHD-type domain-containing protein n=1 Tax=Trichoderma citrinoviride TaxID=58853 RepID=A0A2T4B716_9HYPO|nr:hypothetical protein BBK36DRAFT_1121418 [Trichoderma citrinoviride]PTB65124.1 hypothetical protein BBK36DRAFT_1121418 [Trichoderma citrinoviride]
MSPTPPRGKRRRTEESDTEGSGTVADAGRDAGNTKANTSIPRPQPMSEDVNGNPESMDEAEKRYRAWRKKGSPHDPFCFICKQETDLLDCYTCRRSYHQRCLDRPLEHFNRSNNFFCRVCVNRQWHEHLPPPSPPPSPPLERQRVALPSHRPSVQPGAEVRLPSISPAPAATTSQNAQSSGQTSFTWLSQNQFTAPLTRSSTTASPRTATPLSGVINLSGPGRSIVSGPRGPRSRFSTLSAEVDDAVSLLLRELEYLGDARQKISQLEDVIVRLQQDVRINENALILAQRNAASSSQRGSEALRMENERLKKEMDDLNRLLADEKSRSQFYKADAEHWRSQASSKQAELEELRGKLKGLLGG